MTQITAGRIELDMLNITPEETEKLRDYFVRLAEAGIHRIENGKVILHFQTGNLRKIDIEKTIWSS